MDECPIYKRLQMNFPAINPPVTRFSSQPEDEDSEDEEEPALPVTGLLNGDTPSSLRMVDFMKNPIKMDEY